MKSKREDLGDIVYSCYTQLSRQGEHFVSDHVLSYQISGNLLLNDGSDDYAAEEGSIRFLRRNQLLKFTKQPPPDGEFKSLSIYLNQQTLKNFSIEYDLISERKEYNKPLCLLNDSPELQNYMNSLLFYHDVGKLSDTRLVNLKIKEGLILLLQETPELKNILFDFNEPGKIDIEAFMNENFHFNVNLDRFAYLTGRSLATFKRDFEKIFGITPGKWLIQKRLQEAHYLILEKGKMASEIYLDLGFEDLSHFSFAFKKHYGESPSKIV
ncbi:helix-turn-helix domain-containing protein [Chryseobacterium gwangjuense]|uniref:helix-turn-helix domain-containing protein n=1 Tax=Chryseobacterium gwangjuense TaxID=1069980 RepID=UPI001E2F32FC|nr:AraC family transcriptional regulator [Chryseobacterium gwangjuense]MCE3076595.1 AraC family transcriptional regulator [Chryseobacterium gwangjuense]